MLVFIILIIGCASGFILFSRIRVDRRNEEAIEDNVRVSVIIPARNEEKNLSFLLDSLKVQTYKPHEVIVVDDFSSDSTCEVAGRYDVTVIKNKELPDGWTGKNWAVWNGFLKSSGDILVFLDADVRLERDALKSLVIARKRSKGAISVIPYHHAERFYEKLSLIPCLLGVFAFTSPFERKNKGKGLYGSCIVAAREDYERINGHSGVKSELLDDINLGKRFSRAGVNVENFIGFNLVSFRMYPNGIGSELQGFGKGAVLSTAALRPATTVLIAIWVLGLFSTEFVTLFLAIFKGAGLIPFLIGYIIYAAQIMYFASYTGNFGIPMVLLHILTSLFFIAVLVYSAYQVMFIGSVSWKGRQIKVGGGRRV